MDTIFMNYKNSKATDPKRKLLNLSDIKNIKVNNKYVVLWNLNIAYTWKSIKELYKNNKVKTSAPTFNDKFEIPN